MTGTSSVHEVRPMTGITIRVLDGADRGRVFQNLNPPITIGREEGNTIQLNDERISRYHVKIQEDHERLVITDLESTNGTKVNNEDVQLRNFIGSAQADCKSNKVALELRQWQALIDLQARLAEYLREVGEP